jgi:hypothetical protein
MNTAKIAFLSCFPSDPFGDEFCLHKAPVSAEYERFEPLRPVKSLPERADKLKNISGAALFT